LKLQCEFGSDNSFKRAENLLKALNTKHRPINNHVRISRTIEKIGSIIGEFKTESPVQVEAPANILVAQIDGLVQVSCFQNLPIFSDFNFPQIGKVIQCLLF
jgi:hypothetical protein